MNLSEFLIFTSSIGIQQIKINFTTKDKINLNKAYEYISKIYVLLTLDLVNYKNNKNKIIDNDKTKKFLWDVSPFVNLSVNIEEIKDFKSLDIILWEIEKNRSFTAYRSILHAVMIYNILTKIFDIQYINVNFSVDAYESELIVCENGKIKCNDLNFESDFLDFVYSLPIESMLKELNSSFYYYMFKKELKLFDCELLYLNISPSIVVRKILQILNQLYKTNEINNFLKILASCNNKEYIHSLLLFNPMLCTSDLIKDPNYIYKYIHPTFTEFYKHTAEINDDKQLIKNLMYGYNFENTMMLSKYLHTHFDKYKNLHKNIQVDHNLRSSIIFISDFYLLNNA